eukprot:SAG31_NODE_6480_length_2000_cov_1.640568_2_plen_67_part_00
MEKSSGGGGCAKTVKPILLATLALAGAVVMTGTAVQHATVPMNLVRNISAPSHICPRMHHLRQQCG